MKTQRQLARGRADSLQPAECDEAPQIGARGARGAGDREQRQAAEEAGHPAVAVGEAAQRHEQRGVEDGVAVEHPAEVRQRRPREVPADLGERDVDDEQVEACHERGERQHREHGAGARFAVGRRGRRDNDRGHDSTSRVEGLWASSAPVSAAPRRPSAVAVRRPWCSTVPDATIVPVATVIGLT